MERIAKDVMGLLLDMCKMMDIEKTRTTPWHSKSGSMIERFNRTLETLLRQIITVNPKNLKLTNPIVLYVLQGSRTCDYQDNSKFLHARMRTAHTNSLLVAIQGKGRKKKRSIYQYMQKLERNLQKAHQWAREPQKTSAEAI